MITEVKPPRKNEVIILNLIDTLNSSYEYVCDNSRNVKINYDKIDDMIDQINNSKVDYWLDSNPYGLMDMYLLF